MNMNVKELNKEQLAQLKSDYLYETRNITCLPEFAEVSNEEIFEYYKNVDFVEEDFGC